MSVEVVAGLDAAQVEALYALHSQWAVESGHDIDTDAWATHLRGACGSGRFLPWVAWDGDLPVACAEIHVVYDPITRETAVFAERGFVRAEYRGKGVFDSITQSMTTLVDSMDWVNVSRASADNDKMLRFYERHGFKPIATLMGRG